MKVDLSDNLNKLDGDASSISCDLKVNLQRPGFLFFLVYGVVIFTCFEP